MLKQLQSLLRIPAFYHYSRQFLLLGMPLRTWAEVGNYYKPGERIADLGCGPADILRYIDKHNRPSFYLGIDMSDRYLKEAERKAKRVNIESKFIQLDLNLLSTYHEIKRQLIDILNEYKITTVNLFGVLHHIEDLAVITTLDTVYAAETVRVLNTEDVLFIDHNSINNFYASLDRGLHVRNENQYDALINNSSWEKINKVWTSAGMSKVKYLHYRLSK